MKKDIYGNVIAAACLCLCIFLNPCFAQNSTNKLKIDTNAFGKWPNLESPKLSPNGKFVMYGIRNSPIGRNSIIIKSTYTTWQKKFVALDRFWSAEINNQTAIFQKSNDTLAVTRLGKETKYYPGFENGKLSNDNLLATNGTTLMLLLKNGKRYEFPSVKEYDFVLNGEAILIRINTSKGEKDKIHLITLRDMSNKEFGECQIEGNLNFNSQKDKVAFLISRPGKKDGAFSVGFCDLVNGNSIQAISSNIDSLEISGISGFNKLGDKILATLSGKLERRFQPNKMNLTVWSYRDDIPQFEQKNRVVPGSYKAVITIPGKQLIRLLDKNEEFSSVPPENSKNLCLGYRTDGECSFEEQYWNEACKKSYFLINMNTGSRLNLPELNRQTWEYAYLSPEETHILLYDWKIRTFFSYDLETKELINISKDIDETINRESKRATLKGYLSQRNRGIAGWLNDEQSVLIYDNNDIWKVNLKGRLPAINLTNGYGWKNNIQFSMTKSDDGYNTIYQKDETIVLNALNLKSKENGFFRIFMGRATDPEKLYMGNYLFRIIYGDPEHKGILPIKATQKNIYLVERSSTTNFPNYFLTKNFKSFSPISNVHPESEYEWFTSELHTYLTPDGETLQGILYKPSDFDPKKKYPIIFNYYEKQSNGLNEYLPPAPLCNGCVINVPLILSNGYLVFKADMHYKANEAGKYALQAIESAAKHLTKFSWVDDANMGLQGCSWGGFETNYFVTHSKLFKAACTAAGQSDMMGWATLKYQTVYSSFFFQQFRIVKMPWEEPNIFIDNSPFFHVDKIQTPLLIMHTTVDDAVPFNQGIQLYLAMRKLGKPSWLLEYGGSANHGVFDTDQQEDFSLRMLQFFNHYLKDNPAPKWMVEGIPAKDATTATGLEFIKAK